MLKGRTFIPQIVTILFLAIAMLALGCAHAPAGAQKVHTINDLQSVQTYYADRLEALHEGMSVAEFKQIFPEAYISACNSDWTQYEVDHYAKYVSDGDVLRQNLLWGVGSPHAKEKKQSIWFFFKNQKFYSWSTAPDWPDPDYKNTGGTASKS